VAEGGSLYQWRSTSGAAHVGGATTTGRRAPSHAADARRAPHPREWRGLLPPRAVCDRDTAALGSPGLLTGGAPCAHALATHTRSRDGQSACGERHRASARGPAAQACRRGSCLDPRRGPRAAAGGPALDAQRPNEMRVGWQRDRLPLLLRQQGAPRHAAAPSPAVVLARGCRRDAAPRRPSSPPRCLRGPAPPLGMDTRRRMR
jgi:hypothetical protein